MPRCASSVIVWRCRKTLKKLRKKFIVSNMALVGVVLIVMFFVLTIVTYAFERQQTIGALQEALRGGRVLAFFPNGDSVMVDGVQSLDSEGETDDERRSSVVLIALYDKNRVLAYDTSINSDFTDSEINALLKYVRETDDEGGIITAYNVRFLKIATDEGTKVAFANRDSEIATFAFLLRLYFFVTMVILAIMFLISDYMAKKAIEPVEKSWEKQNQFVADASHELKTPLTVILANMDIMQANKDSTIWEQNKWIENTKSEATRMAELVGDMLFLARSDANMDQQYNFEELNFTSVVEDCVLTFESVAFEKGMTLSSQVAPDLYAYADQTRIKQAVMVLIDNAIKYSGENGHIFVQAEGNQKNVKLTVANTGTEIPKEKQEHLFERFYRVDESRTRERGGYGLGLSIAKNIIEAHGGTIGLEYSNEKGTCIGFSIPTKQGREPIKLKRQ